MSSSVLPKFVIRWRLAIITPLVLMVLLLSTPPPGTSCTGVSVGPGVDAPTASPIPMVCEPRLPLDISWIEAGGDPSFSGVSLALVVSARTDLPSVRLEVLLPDNAFLLSGPRQFNGKLGRGEQTRLELRVTSRGAACLQARATAVTPGGLVFQRGASMDLGADGEPAIGHQSGRLLHAPDGGRSLREYPAIVQTVPPGGVPGEARP